jgi:DNA adenine methylase
VSAPVAFSRSVPFHWAGAKKWMAAIIGRYLPADIVRLVIPFLGRGDFLRLLRALGIEAPAVVSDIDAQLVAAHEGILENPGEVVGLLHGHKALHSTEHYVEVRDGFDLRGPKPECAAAFVYLINASFKGVLKRSVAGKHVNTSARRRLSFSPDAIHAHAHALRNAVLVAEDFAATVAKAGRGDFVLLDPPYPKTLGYGGFTFSDYDQMRLEGACGRLHRKGARFLVTNADVPVIRDLYRDYHIEAVKVTRTLGAKRETTELVITNF